MVREANTKNFVQIYHVIASNDVSSLGTNTNTNIMHGTDTIGNCNNLSDLCNRVCQCVGRRQMLNNQTRV